MYSVLRTELIVNLSTQIFQGISGRFMHKKEAHHLSEKREGFYF